MPGCKDHRLCQRESVHCLVYDNPGKGWDKDLCDANEEEFAWRGGCLASVCLSSAVFSGWLGSVLLDLGAGSFNSVCVGLAWLASALLRWTCPASHDRTGERQDQASGRIPVFEAFGEMRHKAFTHTNVYKHAYKYWCGLDYCWKRVRACIYMSRREGQANTKRLTITNFCVCVCEMWCCKFLFLSFLERPSSEAPKVACLVCPV